MSEPPVLLEVRDGICQIMLNRPGNRNSIDDELPQAFQRTLAEVKQIEGLRCLIITGSGACFCSGADFRSARFQHLFDDKLLMPNEAVQRNIYSSFLGLLEVEVPVIAAMNGHAIGGGLGLALLCDLRVASKTANYGTNFVRLGCTSGLAISYVLPRIIGVPAAMELLLTGRLISGERAERIGLVNYAVESELVLEKAWSVARDIADAAPMAVRAMKKMIYRGYGWDPRPAMEYESHNMAQTLMSQDGIEGMRALLEKRPANFIGR